MAKKIKLTKHEQLMLDTMRHSRERTLMPRPVRFADKTKYNRNRNKAQVNRDFF